MQTVGLDADGRMPRDRWRKTGNIHVSPQLRVRRPPPLDRNVDARRLVVGAASASASRRSAVSVRKDPGVLFVDDKLDVLDASDRVEVQWCAGESVPVCEMISTLNQS
jgi:hypothetical protein